MKIIFLLFLTINSIFAIEIFDVTPTTAKINITNLNIGNSGIIIKKINNNTMIITQAVVINSNKKNSTLKFIDKDIIQQKAIPTTKQIPKNGDQFIINHLYKTSLLIVPNVKAKKNVIDLYPTQNFLNEDFFASHLKIIQQPVPTKETISNFTQSQQIGTIFIVVNEKLYILDSITFKVIDTINLTYNDKSTNVPFLTKIDNIKQGFWDFSADSIKDYNAYYLQLLETK